jgi:hypothetical protein
MIDDSVRDSECKAPNSRGYAGTAAQAAVTVWPPTLAFIFQDGVARLAINPSQAVQSILAAVAGGHGAAPSGEPPARRKRCPRAGGITWRIGNRAFDIDASARIAVEAAGRRIPPRPVAAIVYCARKISRMAPE